MNATDFSQYASPQFRIRISLFAIVVIGCSMLCFSDRAVAQQGPPPGANAREAAELESAVTGRFVPKWELDLELPDDMFTFARVEYYGDGKWWTDYPYSDLNLSFRLQQLTSLEVNPVPALVELTDPQLGDYPFLLMTNPKNNFYLNPDEGENLREHLLNGGFLLVDDFWGERMWRNFTSEIEEKVFPDREPKELAFDHAIFHNVFDMDKIPQVPSHDAHGGVLGETYEPVPGESVEFLKVPRFMAWFDDDGRICMIVNLNNDLGDGWEEEGFATVVLQCLFGAVLLPDGHQYLVLHPDALASSHPSSPRSRPTKATTSGKNSRKSACSSS